MTRFVILTTQRSGSTVLTRSLDKHPDIFCAGEIFHESKKGVYHPEWHFPNWKISNSKGSKLNKLINYPNLKLNAVKHIKKFFVRDSSVKAKGFKLMYSHIKQTPFIWHYIVDNNIKVIVLIRRNAFKMALSRYRMAKTGRAHSSGDVPSESVTVPAQPLLQQTKQLQEVNERLLSLSEKTDRLILYYEDFSDWTNIIQKASSFLDVPFVDIPPALKKISADNWRDDVTNYQEIEDFFRKNDAIQFLVHS